MLQVLDALLCLGVFPSSLWLAACYKGLEGQQGARWGTHAAQGVTPSVTGSTGGSLSSPGMVVPDSAVAGMMKLLQDAANSGMLADLKVTPRHTLT
ncbi:hypothetical protein HaLaN_28618, partial [Haematococcus lacustris]